MGHSLSHPLLEEKKNVACLQETDVQQKEVEHVKCGINRKCDIVVGTLLCGRVMECYVGLKGNKNID